MTDLMRIIEESLNKQPQRKMVITTGKRGWELINHQMEILAVKSQLDCLFETKKITEEQYITVQEMINSPDWDNLTIATGFIQFYQDDSTLRFS